MILLRPVLDFLLLAAILQSSKFLWYRYLKDPQCDKTSWSEEFLLLRVIRGVLIAWLMHAFGLMDEILRTFLGIRLTQGLGSPTSVDRVCSKMSRWGEVVVEGIAVDDFPSLMGLYAGSSGAAFIKRGNSNGRRPDLASTTQADANKSLMRIDRMAATAQMWSVAPWSSVRRYKRVHVKGITLRLIQVKGILNFTFLALDKKRPPRSEQEAKRDNANGRHCRSSSSDSSSRGHSSSGCKIAAGGDGCGGAPRGSGMDDADDIGADSEEGSYVEEALAKNEEREEEAETAATAVTAATPGPAPVEIKRRLSGTSMEAAIMRSLSSARPANGSRKTPSPSVTLKKGAGSGKSVDQQAGHQDCSHSAVGGDDGGSSMGTGSFCRRDSSTAGRTTNGRLARSMSMCVQQPAAEPVGNLGVMKVLGEAFMQRFDSYCRQVSSSLARMGEIKLIPNLRPRVATWGSSGAPKDKKKRYEVGEIFLEDVCVCVDAGVWSDLLGDHVGEVFSPEFRLEVKIGPQELLTPNGEGRLLSEIGGLVSDKLVRLLARLVMRETVKTSTLMSLVMTSLALDTDARGRRQKKLVSHLLAERETGEGCHDRNHGFIGRGSGSGCGRSRAPSLTFGAVGLERRSQSLGDCRRKRSSDGSYYGDGITGSSRAGSFILSDGEGSSIFGGDDRGGGSSSVGSCRDGWGGGWMLKTRKSPQVGLKSAVSWRRPSESTSGVRRIRPPLQQEHQPQQKQLLLSRRRPLSRGHKPPLPNDDGDLEDAGIARKGWLKFGRRDSTGRRGDSSSLGGISKKEVVESSLKGNDDGEGATKHLETVAMAPPWMEGVEASADYECLKPALDVVKRTVLLAVLKETNRYADVRMNSSFTEKKVREKQNGWSWGRRQRDPWKLDVSMELERSMEEELMAAKKAGNDVDRLIMTQLLAQVRETGPKNAFKALASIELSPLIQDLAAETRLAHRLENIGIDMSHVAQSLSGLTAGKVLEEFKNIVGRVGGEARRLKAEAIRIQQELLDETGILPLLNETAGGKEVTSLVSSLSDILIGAGAGGGAGNASPSPASTKDKDSWERGVAVSKYPTEANRSVEKGLGFRDGVELEEIDEVDVVLQVLDLLEAVESLRVGIMNGDGVTLNNLEHALGKVAGKIDVYLVLAAIESVLGLLLESLGKLPVGQSRFSGKGVECRVWNLDLKGLHVSRKNVDLVMKGFRLPKRGTAVRTPFGTGKIKRYKKRSRCFVVNLDWTMSNGKSAKAYLQPNDIVVLEGHEGKLSDEENEEIIGRRGNGRVTADTSEAVSGQSPDENAGGRSCGETHKLSPLGVAGAQPTEAEKGRWLSKFWSRRKNTGGPKIAGDSHLPERKGEAISFVGSGVGGCGDGGGYGDEARDEAGRSMLHRSASAPFLVSPLRTKPRKESKPAGKWVRRSSSTASIVDNPEGLVVQPKTSVVSGNGVQKVAGRDSRSFSDLTTDACSITTRRSVSQGSSQAAEFSEESLNDRARGIMAGPTSAAEITSAPFLVARISDVVVELKDVMWSVKQTAFPRLETAGSLQATVSGLSIELELDSDTREVGPVLEGDREVGDGGRGKRLRLTRLRVSAMTVKIHVNNSALSAVFNLAASAFEAAVKRHVVDNVEAVVRKNLTSLLAIMNQSEKLKILFRGGGAGAEDASGESGDGDGVRLEHAGTVLEKVLARSRSHHVVWDAGHGSVGKCSTDAGSGFVSVGRERGRGRGQSSRKISVGSGPSRTLAGGYDGTETTGARRMLTKRLFRGGLAGPVDGNQPMERRRRPVVSVKSSKREGYKKRWLRGKAVRGRRATTVATDCPQAGDFSGGSLRPSGSKYSTT